MYRTEMEARLAFVAKAARYAGTKEGSAEHKEMIAAYNAATSGYDMSKDDPWCAMFLSAIAALLGYEKVPLECSCSRMVAKAKSMGIRVEGRGYLPQVGDWPIYDLDLNGAMDHIGVVADVDGDDVYVLEGNYSDTVKSRVHIRYDDPRILLWICPDYGELVERATAAGGGSSGGAAAAYPSLESAPEYARPTIRMLMERGWLLGVAEDDLGLTEQMIRVLVILNRAGCFDGNTE